MEYITTTETYTAHYLLKLADHLETLDVDDCHSGVYARRDQFATKLRSVAGAPITDASRAAINTLRLSIYRPMAS